MTLTVGFQPVEEMTAMVYARRLRIAAMLGPVVQIRLSAESARSLAADLDRMVAGAEAVLAQEVARIETETAAAVHALALQMLADQQAALSAKIEEKRAELRRHLRGLAWPVLGCMAIALILWGLS